MKTKVENGIPAPGRELHIAVRGALIARGTSFAAWCREHGVSRPWVWEALMGMRNGTKARAVRARLVKIVEEQRIAA